MTNPLILYSFRRCPYAIRARLAISYSGISVELREVVLRNKPKQLIDISSKATVPVLIGNNNVVFEESIDIMKWALEQSDSENWHINLTNTQKEISQKLINYNDGQFKYYLDRYKYADRYPENSKIEYREKAELFLKELEHALKKNGCLIKEHITLADIAILPFIRQFSGVDPAWFDQSPYPMIKQWLASFLESKLFNSVMKKYKAWELNDQPINFP